MKYFLFCLLSAFILGCSSAEQETTQDDKSTPTDESIEIIEIENEPAQEDAAPQDTTRSADTVDAKTDEIEPQPEKTKDSVDPRVQRILDEKLIKNYKDTINKTNSEK